MIPITLTLKNFMSYGEEGATLSFEGMHIACLSGDNGNGKSALLDGITWALWGKTRASSVRAISDDDIIRVGADEMEVRYEFELNDQRYRVVKKRKRGKSSGTSDWQLTQNCGEGQYVPIGGGSQRETGRQIVQLLSMEYDTFLNSAYLQQGHADEFTRQTPDKRKAILSEILDLNRYDRLEAKAKERYRERKEMVEELEREIKLLDAQIGRQGDHEEQLAAARVEIVVLEKQIGEQDSLVILWRNRKMKLEAIASQAEEAEATRLRLEAEVMQRAKERCENETRLLKIQAVLEQRDSILSDYALLQSARVRREKLEPEIEAFNRANSELQITIGAIEIEKTRLEGELRTQESELRVLQRNAQEWEGLVKQIESLTGELQGEVEAQQKRELAQAETERLQNRFVELGAKNKELHTTLDDLKEVLELLERPQASCPVCDSDLSGAKRETVLAKQRSKRDRFTAELAQVKREGGAAKQELSAAQAALKEWNDFCGGLAVKRSRLQELQKQKGAKANAPKELDEARKKTALLQAQLEKEDFAVPKRIHRQRLEKELERLQLAKAEYEAVTQRARQLADTDKRYSQLQYAEENITQEIAAQERLREAVAAKKREEAEQRAKIAAMRAKLDTLEDTRRESTLAEGELARLQREMNSLRVREGSLLDYIARCVQSAEERKAKAAEHKRVDQERWLYHQLASAFGKKGVQALIIENAIPELRDEANELLARMTDNSMQVSFETTRNTRTTNTEIETLDIRITDDAGTRPYELFSGGEAFRVNFAIRIALSRLLARRSGAKLETLILDEGFGTQDGKGREKLVEVIEAIKTDFKKILVITHVEDLKDSFPQRIEVTKDSKGSHIYVL